MTSPDASAFSRTISPVPGPSPRASRRNGTVPPRGRATPPASSYPRPSIVDLKPGPLSRLAWIFGLR